MLSCSLRLSQECRQTIIQALELVGGATESIFPQVEALLIGSKEYQYALEYATNRKSAKWYNSVVDFLFCELHPEWRIPCRRYYAGNGPMLKDMITTEQLLMFNARMLKALEVAYDLFCERRQGSWGWYRQQVEEAIKAAA
jgi:hypothetical protein